MLASSLLRRGSLLGRRAAVAGNARLARHFSVLDKVADMSPAYSLAKRIMPRISDTEAAALNSGTVGFDRDIFSGNPPCSRWLKSMTSVLRLKSKSSTIMSAISFAK